MPLMSRSTGRNIDDKSHLIQSIQDILSTPKGSRATVREYGCELSEMVDLPINRDWVIQAFSAIAIALRRWEPRFTVKKLALDASSISSGRIGLTVDGVYKPLGRVIRLENILLQFPKAPT